MDKEIINFLNKYQNLLLQKLNWVNQYLLYYPIDKEEIINQAYIICREVLKSYNKDKGVPVKAYLCKYVPYRLSRYFACNYNKYLIKLPRTFLEYHNDFFEEFNIKVPTSLDDKFEDNDKEKCVAYSIDKNNIDFDLTIAQIKKILKDEYIPEKDIKGFFDYIETNVIGSKDKLSTSKERRNLYYRFDKVRNIVKKKLKNIL